MLSIAPNSTIKDALKKLDETSKQILLVVDEKQKLLGTLTDGDIRRALLKGLNFSTEINLIMNKNPIVGYDSQTQKFNNNKLTKHNLKHLPVVTKDNILVDIILLEEVFGSIQNNTNVILMAGGLGMRLRPLTEHTPKPMLKVGKYPILETIIRRFKNQGFNKFTVAVNYKKEVIQNYFQDGQMLDVDITYLHEDKRLGTAGALPLMSDPIEEPLIVMNGDLLTNLDFNNLLSNHNSSGMIATVCVRKHQYQIPYGVIEVENKKLASIKEKPTYEYLTNAGIYILNPEVLNYIPRNEFYDMPELLEALLAENHSVNICTIEDYWLDIGQIDDFKKANLEIKDDFYD